MNKRKQPAVSVIVPIYNVEKYLRQCLDSIVAQTLVDLEIILINDGSKDGSLEIIREYAEKDKRIKVIDKPNEGYGKTMNRGIKAATGEYIGIVESDDWIEPDMYETLYGIAKLHSVDVAKSCFYFYDNETGKETNPPLWGHELDAEQVFDPHQKPAVFYIMPSVWSAIYRRDFLNCYHIQFLETQGASFQDTSFTFKIWAFSDSVYLTLKPLVHYRIGHFSQSNKSKDKVFCVCDEFAEIERFMASYSKLFKKLEKAFIRMKSNSYSWNLNRLDDENREVFRKRMRKEFTPVFKRNALDFYSMTREYRLELLETIYPRTFGEEIQFVLKNMSWLMKYYWSEDIKVLKMLKRFIRNFIIKLRKF